MTKLSQNFSFGLPEAVCGYSEWRSLFIARKDFNSIKIHTFKYSVRKGTVAAKLPGRISPEIQEERSKIIIAISDKKEKEFPEKLKGFPAEVLIEKKDGDMYMGHAGNYLPVYIKSDKDIVNEIIKTIF